MMMDLKQLQYFAHVAELGSFAKASELLDVPQPTLSRQVRQLEISVRASLLYRHGRGVTLTSAGQRFLSSAKNILHLSEAALLELHEGDVSLRGRVVCGLTPAVGRMMIPTYVKAFEKQFPFAELTVLNLLSGQLHEYLRASRIDFAILQDPPPSGSLSIEKLDDQDLFLVGRTQVGNCSRTVALEQLANLPLIMPTSFHVTRQPLEMAAARLGIPLNIRYEIDAADPLFDLVNQGFAHAVSSDLAIYVGSVESGVIAQRIVNPDISIQLYLISPAARNMTPLQEQAVELARSVFTSSLVTLRKLRRL